MSSKTRNYNIDLIKGILIILVIIGHVIPVGVSVVFSRYIIYSFHMPLFIGIAGYLLDMSKFQNMTFRNLFDKYWKRVTIPWIIAVNFYFIINKSYLHADSGYLSHIKTYIMAYIYPYYHLWFVLGFLSYIFITWIILRLFMKFTDGKKNPTLLLIVIGSIISLVAKFIERIDINVIFNKIYGILQYDLRLRNYIFFLLGMIIRSSYSKFSEDTKKKLFGLSGILSICFLIITIILYFNPMLMVGKVISYLLNINLLIFVIFIFTKQKLPRNRLLEFIGVNSLAFYLWHVVGRFVAIKIIGLHNMPLYYIVNVVIVLFEIILIYYGKKIKAVDKYLFGN